MVQGEEGIEMRQTTCLLIIIALLSNVLVLSVNGDEPGTRATVLPMYIHNDITFPSGDYELQHDLTIDHGVNVTFAAGCVIDVFVELNPLTMLVYGNLSLDGNGNSITQSVTFRSIASKPAPGTWNGIRIYGKCNFEARYANIQHAIIGVGTYHTANTDIKSCTFENNSVAGVGIMNSRHLNGKILAPKEVNIESSRFKENGWGVIENGDGTRIGKCDFIDNVEGGILVGNGSYPYSKDLTITGNKFIDNSKVSIQFGSGEEETYGITNTLVDGNEFSATLSRSVNYYMYSTMENSGMTISRNTFGKGYKKMGIIWYASDIKFRQNTLTGDEEFNYPDKGGFHMGGSTNFTCVSNIIQNGNTYLSVSGTNVTIKFNHFSGSAQTDNDRASYIRCYNVSNAWIHGNDGENNGKINIQKSAPVWIFDNNFSNRLARTEYHEPRIYVSDTASSDKMDWIHLYDNYVVGSIQCNSLYRVIINNNTIRDSRRYGLSFDYSQILIDEVLEPSYALVENNTILNCTSWDINTDSRFYLDKLAHYEIIVKNSTFDPHEVMMDWNYSIKACWNMKARTLNEGNLGLNSDMNVVNYSREYDRDHQLSGDWKIIQGPFMSFSKGERWFYDGVDPHYEDVRCNLTFTAEDRMWETTVNWSQYIEMDLILDAAPEFNDPGTIHFDEDTILDLNLSDLFFDLDAIDIEITDSDGNLTFDNDTVRSTYTNWFGSSNVTFRAIDSFGNYTDAIVPFIIDPVNDPPNILLNITEITMDEDSTRMIELGEYMIDVDGDPLEWSFEENEYLTISLDNETWNLTITPLQDWYGNTTLDLHLSDGLEISNITLTVNVEPVNDAPVFDTPENWNITVYRGTLATIDLLTMVSDTEGDEVTFSMNPSSPYITITDGELAILYPENTEDTIFTFEITIDDENGGTDTASLRVIIDHGTAPESEEWDLYSSSVEVSHEGDWSIEAVGIAGIEVYFIIEDEDGDRTPYKMNEDEQYPGNYSLEIDHDEFEEGEIYTYFFTNSTDGESLEPEMSGSEVQPGDDVEEEEVFSIWSLVCGGICISLLVILVIVALVVVVSRRSSPGEEIEE